MSSSRSGDGPRSQSTLIVDNTAPAEERSRGVLTLASGTEAGRVVPLPEIGMTTLGRAGDCDLRFDEASVSGTHAQIARVAGVYVLVDARSTNGTYVNDERAVSPIHLRDGDRIRLGKSVLLRFSLMNKEEEAALKRVYEASLRDGLTGIFNRKHLEERLDAEIAFAVRHKAALSVAMLDVDFFKRVNDTHGHPAGDAVLKSVATVLARTLRTEDLVARYGGEEFTIVARGTDLAQGTLLAERVRAAIESMAVPLPAGPAGPAGQVLRVTASVGVASGVCCGEVLDKATLVAIADRRLYRAKQSGRNRVVTSD